MFSISDTLCVSCVRLFFFNDPAPTEIYTDGHTLSLHVAVPISAGRLDFSVGYDVTDRLRFDIGGTNVLRSRTRTYRGEPFFVGNYFYDETTYTLGVRYRFWPARLGSAAVSGAFSRGWCRLQDSNPRPSVYKTAALPTELNRRSCLSRPGPTPHPVTDRKSTRLNSSH